VWQTKRKSFRQGTERKTGMCGGKRNESRFLTLRKWIFHNSWGWGCSSRYISGLTDPGFDMNKKNRFHASHVYRFSFPFTYESKLSTFRKKKTGFMKTGFFLFRVEDGASRIRFCSSYFAQNLNRDRLLAPLYVNK